MLDSWFPRQAFFTTQIWLLYPRAMEKNEKEQNFAFEEIYLKKEQLAIWPWSDLVSLVTRHGLPSAPGISRVLELGFGAGANIPFLLSLGYSYCGVEGSTTAAGLVMARFPLLRETLVCGDFTRELEFGGSFELVVDRSSLCFNDEQAIRRCLALVAKKMPAKAHFISVDWFSDRNVGAGQGTPIDSTTRDNIESGQFSQSGKINFGSPTSISSLFSEVGLKIIFMQEKSISTIRGGGALDQVHALNFVAEKT